MLNENARQYDEEWTSDSDEDAVKPTEEMVEAAAKAELALEALKLVNESIRMRNTTSFSSEIRRAFKLYNAVSIDPGEDLLADFEGTRTAVKNGSKVVQNIVRQLVNDGASQLGDMLFPTDQDNYGILPLYPAKPPLKVQNEQAVSPNGTPLKQQDAEGNEIPVTHLQAWNARKIALDHKTGRMKTKIKNHLTRMNYGKLGRKLIKDGALTGTAVLKGPYVDHTLPKKWVYKDSKQWSLAGDSGIQASYKVVSVLDFLPDMSAEDKDSMAFMSFREWFLPRQLRRLLESGKHYKEAIRRILANRPRHFGEGVDEGDVERNSLKDTALVEELYNQRYEVFETWAEFNVGLLRRAGVKAIPAGAGDEETILACVIHCQGECLKAYLNPQVTGQLPVSLWYWDEDPTSIFGKGIPILAENCQMIYNAVWRMILDHGGLSAVPMVGVLKDKVEPAGGDKSDYSLRGGKVWAYKADLFNLPDSTNKRPFEVFDIPVHLDQFFAIMEKAEEDAYKLTGVTRIEKNQQGVDNAPLTLGATQIFQNNASVARRRQVRDFDDAITKDALTRLYDWLMQFEPDGEDFKGPMEIEPRGSSVLMQREVNLQNLLNLYQLTENGNAEGVKKPELLRAIQSSMQFPEGKFIETEEETNQRLQSQAENPPIPPEVSLEMDKLAWEREKGEATVEIQYMLAQVKAVESQSKLELASVESERKHTREMMKLELMGEVEGNKILARLQERREDIDAKVQTAIADIKSKRDIAAGQILTKDRDAAVHGDAQMVMAMAKSKEAATKERELDAKLSGKIEQGI